MALAARRRPPTAWLSPGVLLGAMVPLVALIVRAWTGTLGANPIEEALNQLGLLALIFLVASLAPTPLKLLFGLTWPVRIRRLLGLLAFFYATLHFLTYLLLDRAGELGTLLADLTERPFITIGFLAWLLLVPLALTSTHAMVKRLGFAQWKQLHRLSYVVSALAVLHFVWRVKKDVSEPLAYGVLLAFLLGTRMFAFLQARRAKAIAAD
jgi:methionine sulfoxide reductase heme-binding subunit